MNLALSILFIAAAAADPSAEQRAKDVLGAAREAIAGKRAAVKGLSLEAELRRVQAVEGEGNRDLSGEITIDALSPDRYLKVETLSPFPGAPAFSIGTGLDGSEAWRAPIGNPGGHGMVIRVADGGGAPGAAEALLRRTRADLARFLLLALASPADGFTFAYAGEAESPEGRAERIDVSDAQGPVGTLFVDKKSHRPLFIGFKTQAPRMQVMRSMGAPGDSQPRGAEPRPSATPESEARLFVSDWKAVDGVMLPHKFSQTIENRPSEEWTIKKWKIDPAFKADTFKKQK